MPISASKGRSRTLTRVVQIGSGIFALFGCQHGVAEQAGDSHGSDAARYRGHGLGMVEFMGGTIAHDLRAAVISGDAVDPHVAHDRAGADPIAAHQVGRTSGGIARASSEPSPSAPYSTLSLPA